LASELRLLLAAICVPLLLGIWWWSARRSRQAPGNAVLRESLGSAPAPGRDAGGFGDAETDRPAAPRTWGVPPFEPLSIRTADFDHELIDDLRMTARVDRSEDLPMTSHADRGEDLPMTSHADRSEDLPMTSHADRGEDLPMTSHADRGEDLPMTSHADRSEDLPMTAHADRGEDPPMTSHADRGEDHSVSGAAGPQIAMDERSAGATDEMDFMGAHPAPVAARPEPDCAPGAKPAPTASAAGLDRPSEPAAGTDSQAPSAGETRRIVTVRVSALGDGRWLGSELMRALEKQGLVYGRYQVFHRRLSDGRSQFCAASLVEPGTFDIERMPQEEFRGVTLFAVLPGPAEPLQTHDALIHTAARLAETLHGVVQDSHGVPLSPQRADALRADVARFQSLSVS
jgi:FtsZ-interacting cell division protein ZipA